MKRVLSICVVICVLFCACSPVTEEDTAKNTLRGSAAPDGENLLLISSIDYQLTDDGYFYRRQYN